MTRFVTLFAGLAALVPGTFVTGSSSACGGDERGTIAEGELARTRDLYGDPLPGRAGGGLGTVRLHDGGQIVWAAWSPDGKSVASCTYQGNVRVWDAATGQERRTLARGEADI